jgi:hypothetical protein
MRFFKMPKPVWFVILLLTASLAAYLLVVNRDEPEAELCSIADPSKLDFLVNAQGVPVIILDTDFAADVDDVGALAILNAMADSGEADILGVMISSGDYYALRAVDTINTYYGRPDIPIGATWDPAVSVIPILAKQCVYQGSAVDPERRRSNPNRSTAAIAPYPRVTAAENVQWPIAWRAMTGRPCLQSPAGFLQRRVPAG